MRNTKHVRNRWTLAQLVKYSLFKSPNWRENLDIAADRAGVSRSLVWKQTDQTNYSEGLYLKVEDDDRVDRSVQICAAKFLSSNYRLRFTRDVSAYCAKSTRTRC
jgi:hypothetical protein